MKLFSEIGDCPKCNGGRVWDKQYSEGGPAETILGNYCESHPEAIYWSCRRCGYTDRTHTCDYIGPPPQGGSGVPTLR